MNVTYSVGAVYVCPEVQQEIGDGQLRVGRCNQWRHSLLLTTH